MKNWIKILNLSAVLVAASAAYAQPGLMPPSAQPGTSVSTTTTTTTGTTDTMDTAAPVGAEDAGTMPTTGGEPLLMVLGGGVIPKADNQLVLGHQWNRA